MPTLVSFTSDIHAFVEGRQLVLAGVQFKNFSKGPNTKRSDGDIVAHAIVMALAGATNTSDIDDWFPDQGETDIVSRAIHQAISSLYLAVERTKESSINLHLSSKNEEKIAYSSTVIGKTDL